MIFFSLRDSDGDEELLPSPFCFLMMTFSSFFNKSAAFNCVCQLLFTLMISTLVERTTRESGENTEFQRFLKPKMIKLEIAWKAEPDADK